MLLRLEGVHLHRHFGRRDDVRHEDEAPAVELRAVAEVEIFGERVVLPAAGVGDGRAAPDAGGAVEVEEPPGAVAAAVLEHEVTVEQNRLDLRQQRVVVVDVAPARLHHADSGIAKCGMSRVRKSGGGMKSASKIATNSPRATLRPSSSAPALYPMRLVRCRYLMSCPARRTAGRRARRRRASRRSSRRGPGSRAARAGNRWRTPRRSAGRRRTFRCTAAAES